MDNKLLDQIDVLLDDFSASDIHKAVNHISKRKEVKQNIETLGEDYVKYHEIPIDMIAEFGDELGWDKISIYQELPINFIIKYKEKLNLAYIFISHDLSDSDIDKLGDKIRLDFMRLFNDEENSLHELYTNFALSLA